MLTAAVTGRVLAVAAPASGSPSSSRGTSTRELAETNRLRKLLMKAPRGLIFDRKGRLLVENVPSYSR